MEAFPMPFNFLNKLSDVIIILTLQIRNLWLRKLHSLAKATQMVSHRNGVRNHMLYFKPHALLLTLHLLFIFMLKNKTYLNNLITHFRD